MARPSSRTMILPKLMDAASHRGRSSRKGSHFLATLQHQGGQMHTRLFALAAAALAACGGSVNTTPGQSSSCSVTLSGGLTGTYDCKPAVTAWASSNNQGGFSFGVAQSGSTPSISVAVGMPGEPHTGTYTTTTSGVDSAIAINTGSGGTAEYWI